MARQGDEWPHHPQLSPPCLTALPVCAHARHRPAGSAFFSAGMSPKCLFIPFQCQLRDMGSAPGATDQDERRNRPEVLMRRAIPTANACQFCSPEDTSKTTCHAGAGSQRINIPSRSNLIAWRMGLLHVATASHHPPANAGKSAMGWKPAGPKSRSGFGSRQPCARGLSPRGRTVGAGLKGRYWALCGLAAPHRPIK